MAMSSFGKLRNHRERYQSNRRQHLRKALNLYYQCYVVPTSQLVWHWDLNKWYCFAESCCPLEVYRFEALDYLEAQHLNFGAYKISLPLGRHQIQHNDWPIALRCWYKIDGYMRCISSPGPNFCTNSFPRKYQNFHNIHNKTNIDRFELFQSCNRLF